MSPARLWRRLVGGAVAALLMGSLVAQLDPFREGFAERHRAEAQAFCHDRPESKFVKYRMSNGSDPAPHLDAFEYCVGAYISHLPRD